MEPIFDLNTLNLTSYPDLISFILGVINLTLMLAAVLAVGFLVYAGFLYITSGGEGDKAEKAQKAIIYTLIGLLLVFISPIIIRFVLNNVLQIN